MILDDLLERLRESLVDRERAARTGVESVRLALDAYVDAREQEIAAEFAARNGLPLSAPAANATEAALVLSELVGALPELVAAGASASSAPPVDGVEATRSPVRSGSMELPTLDHAQRTLASEFDAAAFAGMRRDEFLLYAAEFAAAARALQERTGGDPLSLRVIRKLTALVHERELAQKVFGLSRSHTGDWQLLANEARARRLKAEDDGHRGSALP